MASRNLRSNVSLRERCRGAILIWTAIVLGLLLILTGYAVDTAFVGLATHQIQNCADASALAGAYHVRTDLVLVRDQAQTIALENDVTRDPVTLVRNDGNAAGGDIVIGRWDRDDGTFTVTEENPNAVQVTARRLTSHTNGPVPLIFGPAFGIDIANRERSTIAMSNYGIGAGVIALNRTAPCAFDVRGTAGEFVVDGGVIVVDSDHDDAACHAGKPTIAAEELRVVGDTDKNYDKVELEGDLLTDQEYVPDPLAWLPEPEYDPAAGLGVISPAGGETIEVPQPGYYDGGFIVHNGTVNVPAGIYILGGAGLDVNGGNLIAHGVMFFIVNPGYVDIRGNGIIDITPPSDEYTYAGTPDATPYIEAQVSIFQARDNTNPSRILGTANFSIDGNLYFPAAHLQIGGTSDNFASGLIADTIELHGDGLLQINYEGQFPPLPGSVWIVQ